MKLSVVIPMYGCRAAIPELHRRLTDTLAQLTADYEIIMVNDNCPQNSWESIQELCEKDTHVIGLELSRNFGQLKAILAGLDYSAGDWVVVMDCDLQDRPEEILNLYQKAQEGYDVVIARRAVRQDSPFKVFVSKCFYSLYSFATETKYDPSLCNFSISKRIVIDNYCRMRESHRGFVMYIMWMGFHWTTLDVEHNSRFEGTSSYNFKKRFEMALDLLTSQSDKLLKITALGGLCIAFLSFLSVLITVIRYCIMDIAPGFSSLLSAIFLMGGLTITSVGIVGLYVGNIFMEVKSRPLYIVRTALNHKESDS